MATTPNEEQKAMRIHRLKSENVKRLSAVDITPEGDIVIIGGENGAGKSSVLDSILFGLGGGKAICERPLRDGAEHGSVDIDLGEFQVRRTFTATGGGTLTVTAGEGFQAKSPQQLLDALVGSLTFDPLSFSRMKPADQADTLRELVGLDTSDIEADYGARFAKRAEVNRDLKAATLRRDDAPHFPDVGTDEQPIAELLAELEAAAAINAEADALGEFAKSAENSVAFEEGQLEAANIAVDEAQAVLERVSAERGEASDHAHAATVGAVAAGDAYRAAPLVDADEIKSRLAALEETNRRVRANQDRGRLTIAVDSHTADAVKLKNALEKLKQKKANRIAEAKFPVDGLSLDKDGVTLGGVPFGQASTAEQLRASVAIGLASNPRLRIMLVHDGSLLDDKSLELLAEIAAEHEAQVWLERVGDGDASAIVIEDGHVLGVEPEPEVEVEPEPEDVEAATDELEARSETEQNAAPSAPEPQA